MNTATPRPDVEFKEASNRLRRLIESGSASAHSTERRRLEKFLQGRFVKAFGLLPDRLRLAERLYYRFINSEAAPNAILFDHREFYQRDGRLIIVSQPYGIEKAELTRWALQFGVTYTIADEWGYYYPGHASLFLVEFDNAARSAMDSRVNNPIGADYTLTEELQAHAQKVLASRVDSRMQEFLRLAKALGQRYLELCFERRLYCEINNHLEQPQNQIFWLRPAKKLELQLLKRAIIAEPAADVVAGGKKLFALAKTSFPEPIANFRIIPKSEDLSLCSLVNSAGEESAIRDRQHFLPKSSKTMLVRCWSLGDFVWTGKNDLIKLLHAFCMSPGQRAVQNPCSGEFL